MQFRASLNTNDTDVSSYVLDHSVESTDTNKIPSFPLEILGFWSILGIVAIFKKKR